jgi:uncharacterized membrane protein
VSTDTTALVHDYLAAVERETATLPPAARQELLADLHEHLQVSLAERPGAVHEIIRDMGDPRVIAATARQELGLAAPLPAGKPERPRSPAWLPLALLLLSDGILPVFGNAVPLAFLTTVMEITALVIVCRSRHWTVKQKWAGIVLTAVVSHVTAWTWNFATPDDFAGRHAWRLALALLVFATSTAGCALLWRTRRREPRPAGDRGFPVWAS